MLEQLPGPDSNIIRVRVSGKLRHEDFEQLFALIDAAVAGKGKCRLQIELHDFQGWDFHGLWDDIKFHTTHSTGIERIAYVGDKTWEKLLISVVQAFPGAVIRYFDASSLDAARVWLEDQ